MNFNDFFKDDLILLNKSYKNKTEALKDFAKHLVKKGYATNEERVVKMALKRESESSTGIGENIAIPHIRDEVMKKSCIFFAKVNDVEWESLDAQPVKYVFFICLNPNDSGTHIEILAALMKLFMNPQFKEGLLKVETIKQLISLMNKYSEEDKEQEKAPDGGYDVVAVTACPTGIAHTFMARDMLNKAADEMGIKIKVETQGADGVKNALSSDDIKNAKGVIIACDRVVELSKFSGHPNVLEMGTKPVIKDAKKEIQRILNGEGKKFEVSAKSKDSENNAEAEMSFNNFGKRSYKSLMTGVSYMLPFIIFGGIIIAIAFLIDMNNAGNSDFGSGNDVSKWLKAIGDLSFGMMVPILGAYITFAIVGRQGLLPGFMVGLMARGDFFFSLNPDTGAVEWLTKPGSIIGWIISDNSGTISIDSITAQGANSGVFGAIGGAFLAATILILFSKLFAIQTKKGKPWYPSSLNGIKNILLIPLFGTFLIVLSFWIVNVPLIYLNYGFTKFLELFEGRNELAWLLGLILGAMMSVDLGGPINKAAYVFGTTSLSTAGGEGTISMAAAMAGGMTAPLGIALSVTFFKKLWTKEERDAGYVNYVMGATFISEGAIPLTLKNPKVMLPSNIIGSAVAGLLIGALGVKIAAPHGGILTVALARCGYFEDSQGLQIGLGVVFFIAAVVAGSITSMFCILLFRKIFDKKAQNKKDKSLGNDHSKKSVKKIFGKSNKKNNEELVSNISFNEKLLLKNNILILGN